MRITGFRLGFALALANLLMFAGIVASKAPNYAELERVDALLRSGSTGDLSSAEPMYLAARPFYSPVHVADVPRIENFYLLFNTPAMIAAFSIDDFLRMGGFLLSSSSRSWLLAITFALFAMAEAFLVGVGVGWMRNWRRAA